MPASVQQTAWSDEAILANANKRPRDMPLVKTDGQTRMGKWASQEPVERFTNPGAIESLWKFLCQAQKAHSLFSLPASRRDGCARLQ